VTAFSGAEKNDGRIGIRSLIAKKEAVLICSVVVRNVQIVCHLLLSPFVTKKAAVRRGMVLGE
jgi:hypothetical protein